MIQVYKLLCNAESLCVYLFTLLLLLLLLLADRIIAAVGIQEVTSLTELRYLALLPLGYSAKLIEHQRNIRVTNPESLANLDIL